MTQSRIGPHGGAKARQWAEVAEPSADPDQVKVRVRAVGLNHPDLWVRRDLPFSPLRLSLGPRPSWRDLAEARQALENGVVGKMVVQVD